MHYHLASSYYSFFFLYIYISRVPNLHENQQNAHVSSVMNFPKKKEMFVLTYIRVCTPMCVHIRVCNNTKRMFLVSISPLCRVFSIFWIFLYILLLPLLFFFLPLRLLLHCRLVLLLFSEVCYYYIVKCPTDQLQWATIIYKSC